ARPAAPGHRGRAEPAARASPRLPLLDGVRLRPPRLQEVPRHAGGAGRTGEGRRLSTRAGRVPATCGSVPAAGSAGWVVVVPAGPHLPGRSPRAPPRLRLALLCLLRPPLAATGRPARLVRVRP